MENETHSEAEKKAAASSAEGNKPDQAVDEFFTRLQSEMRRPDLSQEAISAAFQAIQKLAMESDVEEASNITTGDGKVVGAGQLCSVCNAPLQQGSKFCAACGVPIQSAVREQASSASAPIGVQAGAHHYHHHYHHHYFPEGGGGPLHPGQDLRSTPAGPVATRDTIRPRQSGTPTPVSRSETALRRMTQDWAQACNTKQLNDLVDFYAPDAMMLRPNVPPIRGTAAIREFFFSSLDAGLGDAEFEPLRVELFGDIAYEAGRCKILVPVAVGKRREERGKYLILYAKQADGNWKAITDCWSSDLSLGVGSDAMKQPAASNPAISLTRLPRKGY